MGRGRALLRCNIVVAGQYREYGSGKVNGWISNLGGQTFSKVTEKITHVVATEKAWKRKDQSINNALRLNKEGAADIKIVSFDWLEDSVNNKTKKREGPYLWEKLDAAVAKQDAAKAREEKAKEKKAAKGHMGMMAEVFEESTKDFVDAKEAREIERQIEEERRVQATMEEEKRLEKEAKRAKHAERFKRGVKKAMNEIFSENHHIYMDDTLFRYEVVCTKVDTRCNRNARVVLTFQIYESNAEPHTYAVNMHYAATHVKNTNEIIAPMGSTFPVAFHVFKKAFKERTGAEWDDRITAAIERKKNQRRDRGIATGSEDQGSRKGTAVNSDIDEEEKRKKEAEEFSRLPFEYHPPAKGPRGNLPKEKEPPVELVNSSNSAVEQWMSGAIPNEEADPDAVDLVNEHGTDALRAIGNGEVNHFDDFMNGDGADNTNGDYGNIFDQDISHWVNNNLDDSHPFDHHDENMAFLDQVNGNEANDQVSRTGTLTHDADTAKQNGTAFEDTLDEHNDISFNNINSNMGEQPISFDLPSTIPDSFEHGTQEVTETQMAERAQGEFDEFIDLNHSASPTILVDTPHKDTLGLGSSILGKRKTADVEDEADIFSPKKVRLEDNLDEDEDEAFALASEEAYQLTASPSAFNGYDAQMGVPRALLDQSDHFASDYLTAAAEETELEDDGMVQYGRA